MEFHAVILCGKGKALSPLSQVRTSGIPKALLPIANKPMIEYVLEWCEKAFFPRITVVATSNAKEDIEDAVNHYKTSRDLKLASSKEEGIEGVYTSSINVIDYDAEYSGEVLYHLYKTDLLKSQLNFVLLPCDFITNLPPQVLIEAYRYKEDSDLGLYIHYRNHLDIEDKKRRIFPKNYTIYSELSDGRTQLLDLYTTEDIMAQQALQVRSQMCWKFPNSVVSTKLLNSAIFFGNTESIFKVFDSNPVKFNDVYFRFRPISKIIRDLARLSWQHNKPQGNIGFMVLPDQATFFRCNNLPVLMEANRYFMKIQASKKGQQQVKDKVLANVGVDSLIGNDTTLGEKTNVKRTVVASNCTVGKRVKLTGSLILSNVTIEDDVQLENCIIGHDVVIRAKLRLTNCNVESTHEVTKGTQAKGENLLCLTLEGLVEGEESAIASSDSDSESGSEDESDMSDYHDEYVDNDDGLFGY